MTLRCTHCIGGKRVPVRIPLTSVHVTGTAVDSFARLTLEQRYSNDRGVPLEAVYRFPLDEHSAVCGFEAEIDGSIVRGEVQEKGRAFETYDKAISEGHGAYLAEEERADVFTISVGNLPPGKSVDVRITYLTRLRAEGDDLRLSLPATIGERYSPQQSGPARPTARPAAGSAGVDIFGDLVAGGAARDDASNAPVVAAPTSASANYPIRITLDLRMTASVRSVTSPSHPISFEIGEGIGRGTVTLARDEPMDTEAVFVIATRDAHRPTACCEIGAGAAPRCTAMVSLFPSFGTGDVLSADAGEIVFVVDRSGSMSGSKMEQCKNALQFFLRSLPAGARFNIVSFGSSHTSLFPGGCRALDDASLRTAANHVAAMSANMGGTEILRPLREIVSAAPQPPTRGSRQGVSSLIGFFSGRRANRRAEASAEASAASAPPSQRATQVILLTDGQVSNTQAVLECVAGAASAGTHRFFSLGIGNGASHELVAGIARRGRGVAEFVATGERMEAKVMRQLRRATRPALEGAKIEWLRGGRAVAGVTTCPPELPPVFSGDRFTVFANFPDGSAAPDAARLTGSSVDGRVDVTLAITGDAVRAGDLLAKLAARETIRHLQETRGDTAKDEITRIALDHGLASRHTSFVAVEKRDIRVDSAGMDLVVVPQCAPRPASRMQMQQMQQQQQQQQMQMQMQMQMQHMAPMKCAQRSSMALNSRSRSLCSAAPAKMDHAAMPAAVNREKAKMRKKKNASAKGGRGGGGGGGFFGFLGGSLASTSKCSAAPSPPPPPPAAPAMDALMDMDFACGAAAPAAPMSHDVDLLSNLSFCEDEDDDSDCDERAALGDDCWAFNGAENAFDDAGACDLFGDAVVPGARTEESRPDALVRLQCADGHFEFDAAFAAVTGVTAPEGWSVDTLRFWATAIAVARLRAAHTQTREEWEMIAAKAISWLASHANTKIFGCSDAESAVSRASSAFSSGAASLMALASQ